MTVSRRTALGLFGGALCAPGLAFGRRGTVSGKDFTGENPLGVPRAEFRAAQDGMDLIYQRRYKESLQVFEVAGVDFPDSPLGPAGRAVVWQAVMYENYNFDHDRAYRGEYADGMERVRRGRRDSSRKAWNEFLEAVLLGMDAMFDIRHGEFLGAFNKAWEAMERVKSVQRLAPDFHDVQLALGMYNYWRTAITESVDGLPTFGDKRDEGLAQMIIARDQGWLAKAPASLVLTYSYLEKKDYKLAIAEAESVRADYPTNVLVETTLGRVYRKAKRYPDSLAAFDRVLALDPRSARVWFHIGETHYSAKNNNDGARDAYDKYLATGPADEYRAHTYYRLGMLEKRARKYDEAIAWFQQAIDTFPKFKKSKKRLEETLIEKTRKDSRTPEGPRKGGGSGGKVRQRVDG
jgi:tetratricopeptide (TPR) repeat protein